MKKIKVLLIVLSLLALLAILLARLDRTTTTLSTSTTSLGDTLVYTYREFVQQHLREKIGNRTASIVVKPAGVLPDGRPVKAYLMTGFGGLQMEVLDLGGTVRTLSVPTDVGTFRDITVGFNTPTDYTTNLYFGALIGRYGSRISKGKFSIGGTDYSVSTNEGPNSLHGGVDGFNLRTWTVRVLPLRNKTIGIELALRSPDGDQGFPGNLDIRVNYLITEDNTWRIEYSAQTDKPTPCNLTQHIYFNLNGAGSGTVMDQQLRICADHYIPVDPKELLPTGEIAPVEATAFDFRKLRRIADPYDHNWCLDQKPVGTFALAAEARGGGIAMEVWTDQPGIQFYDGSFMTDGMPGKDRPNCKHGGFALETQHWPDSPNHANFPSTILRPGETYSTVTEYRFRPL